MYLKTLLSSARLPFLLLAPACMLPGIVIATQHSAVPTGHILLVLLAGIAAHAAVNLLNEYQDFSSGLDYATEPTPFSGGSGALPAKPEAANSVRLAAFFNMGLTVLIGLYFVYLQGPLLLLPGITGLLLIILYTGWINRLPLLCLISPGIAFGPLMVAGTELALTGQNTAAGLTAALLVFFLVNNLLLLNQYPDLEADRRFGRRHFTLRFGIATANRVYLLFLLMAITTISMAVTLEVFPPRAQWTLAGLLPALVSAFGVFYHQANIGKQTFFLACNVVTALLTPLLLAICLL